MAKAKKQGIFQVYIGHVRHFWTWYSDGTVAAFVQYGNEPMQPNGTAAEDINTTDDWKRFKATKQAEAKAAQ